VLCACVRACVRGGAVGGGGCRRLESAALGRLCAMQRTVGVLAPRLQRRLRAEQQALVVQKKINRQMWADLQEAATALQRGAVRTTTLEAELLVFQGGGQSDPDKERRGELIRAAISEAGRRFEARFQLGCGRF
jgi:hypothetical protein